MCHSATLYKNNIYIYGGMKNADVTFEDLIVLSLDGKTGNFKESIIIIYIFIIFQYDSQRGFQHKRRND